MVFFFFFFLRVILGTQPSKLRTLVYWGSKRENNFIKEKKFMPKCKGKKYFILDVYKNATQKRK